jgi:uncharacterized protein (UPF0332 family)
MYDREILDLARIRLENAKQCLITASSNFNNGDFKASANRAYYSIFHAMRSVLALDKFDSKKHSGVISEFRRKYIKTKVFTEELSEIISSLFLIRTESDYNDFYLISREEVKEQIVYADKFVLQIEKYILKMISENKNN